VARPRFLADEDLRFEIVLAVRRLEPAIDFPTVVELGRAGALDEQVLEFAHSEGRIVVSHDVNTLRGLANERVSDGRGVSGVLLTAQGRPTREVAESIRTIWGASEADEWVDRVVFIPF
jgi:predicted nuclease of predicted toxin-antitoxin system